MTHPKTWLKHFSVKFRLWTKIEIFLPKKEHFMRTGFMYFGQLFKVFISFTAVKCHNFQPRFWQNLPRGIFSVWCVSGCCEFSFGQFLSKNTINNCCFDQWFMPSWSDSVRDQSVDHKWGYPDYFMPFVLECPVQDYLTLRFEKKVFDYDKIIFSFQLQADNNIRWLRNIFINYMD